MDTKTLMDGLEHISEKYILECVDIKRKKVSINFHKIAIVASLIIISLIIFNMIPAQVIDIYRKGEVSKIKSMDTITAIYPKKLLMDNLPLDSDGEYNIDLYYEKDGDELNYKHWYSLCVSKTNEKYRVEYKCLFDKSKTFDDWKKTAIYENGTEKTIIISNVKVILAFLSPNIYCAIFESDGLVYNLRLTYVDRSQNEGFDDLIKELSEFIK